jgi:copper chaperone
MAHTKVKVPSIACQGCARSITQALGRVPGVEQVDVDVASKYVDVDFDASKTDEKAIKERIEDAGYPVEG